MAATGPDFDDFVVARSPALLRTAVLLCGGDVQAGEDLLQQALLKVAFRWRAAQDNPTAYTRAALVNLSHDRRRRLRRRPAEAPWATVAEQAARDLAVDDGDGGAIERDVVVAVLRELPARQRVAVILRYWEDLSVEETAHLMGCSTGTVKSNASRGLDRLRLLLTRSESTS
jgi:RNA polymerase sigma-70 factor (sigma-E family)